ncbi:hypothetical protein B0T16DRAFT_419150 [Cercophora newfieldiana]|uniref:Uncharacterized protein n=1 Tax=Cercophora newfieldiana TaxID=92897 RepID=A0AA39XVN7_9PEZI|nr:hypothetical protein B0T16DRAFT_419150 [Cercophora newfieldiana]
MASRSILRAVAHPRPQQHLLPHIRTPEAFASRGISRISSRPRPSTGYPSVPSSTAASPRMSCYSTENRSRDISRNIDDENPNPNPDLNKARNILGQHAVRSPNRSPYNGTNSGYVPPAYKHTTTNTTQTPRKNHQNLSTSPRSPSPTSSPYSPPLKRPSTPPLTKSRRCINARTGKTVKSSSMATRLRSCGTPLLRCWGGWRGWRGRCGRW